MVALSISNSLLGKPNTTVPVDLLIDDATGLQSADVIIKYDTSILDLVVNDAEGNSSSVTLGSLTSGWTDTVNIDETNGTVTLSLFDTDLLTGGNGSLATINFQIKADAPLGATSILDIETASLGINGQDVSGGITLNDGSITLGSINLDADGSGTASFARDGLLISAFLFFNNDTRTDFSVLDRFVRDPAAIRKTGNEVANYLKGLLPATNAGLAADADDLAPSSDILGSAGKDTLTGDSGNNNLVGDAGDDLLTGGSGSDTFTFAANSGNDIITDFTVGEDLISLDSSLGFGSGDSVFAALTAKGFVEGQLSSELNLGASGTVTIFHDGALTADNFAVI